MNQTDIDTCFLKTAYKAISDKFGEDIRILDIRDVSVLTDYFIIASGNNANQIKAIADEVDKQLHAEGFDAKHVEGYHTCDWVLMDYGSFIIHIFDHKNRSFYSIERVWGDAAHIDGETL